MKTIVSVSPFDCRMWDMHDRLEVHLSEESCKAEIDSFLKHGQLIPVLGRPLTGDPTHKLELIYGARRLFVARHLNIKLLVELRNLSDREAIVAMDIENRQRSDLSPYERGASYARWLQAGLFSSQVDVARALLVSASQVSRLLKLAQLPALIVEAFDNPKAIHEGWGLEIMQLLEDPIRREATLRVARSISRLSRRPGPREIYRKLLSPAVDGRRIREQAHDEVVKDREGQPLFRIRQQSSSLAFVVPFEKVGPTMREELRLTIARILQSALASSSDASVLGFKESRTGA